MFRLVNTPFVLEKSTQLITEMLFTTLLSVLVIGWFIGWEIVSRDEQFVTLFLASVTFRVGVFTYQTWRNSKKK